MYGLDVELWEAIAGATYIIGRHEITKTDIPLVDEVTRHIDHGKGSIGRAPVAPLGTLLLESRFIILGNRGNKHMQVRLGLW